MKTVKGSTAVWALMIGFAAAACAQPANAGTGVIGMQSNGSNATGGAPGTGLGTGAGTSAPPAVGRTGAAGGGPALSNMRANGTSLNENPDPRAPHLAGRPLPPN
ncbi:hypothetical protein [Paraburkholderia aromaticivorans]|uniref:Lipoprotein n=1 Tax=Paraburkholderia aromaticivorans TaxID=2026199 RepID=A0A248VNZ4_9BURK|nr:hypothetical protein [Paraburkholderia aromaticivorans]ASW00595.1 hypothetical protein CJU94_20230 [Paraburkholderia aromaticivorans]